MLKEDFFIIEDKTAEIEKVLINVYDANSTRPVTVNNILGYVDGNWIPVICRCNEDHGFNSGLSGADVKVEKWIYFEDLE